MPSDDSAPPARIIPVTREKAAAWLDGSDTDDLCIYVPGLGWLQLQFSGESGQIAAGRVFQPMKDPSAERETT